jgi:UDP-N-acetyl-2-amino-2-deoxyglucuronate dehydrogenase
MKKLRVGIIGCGNIFPVHALSILKNGQAEIVAICDIKEERVKHWADVYNCMAYLDYREMIDQAKLDVVHICTPHYLHAPMVIYAANAGKHVMTEKPMSITVEDAHEMIEACEKNHVFLGVIFQNRYNSGSAFIKSRLEQFHLGHILGGKCSVTWKRTDEYYSQSDWKGTWDMEGGGVLIDQAIHTLDLMRWFVGEEIDYVEGYIDNRTHHIIEVEDIAEGIIKFKNGIYTSFYTNNYYSYDAPVEIELHCEHAIAKMVGDKATITFHDGFVAYCDLDPADYVNFGDGVKSYWGVSHVKQISEFYQSILNGIPPEIDGNEALKTQEMIASIYESGKTKKRVYLKKNVDVAVC